MSESIEMKGKTVEEAVNEALKELNISKEEAVIEVIEEPVKGLLGLGSKPAIVKVIKKEHRTKIINEFLQKITSLMNLKVDSTISKKENEISINLTGEDMGLLIGHKGETLDALQSIVNVIVNKGNNDEYIRVELDAENYREKRKETLINLAKRKATDVLKYKKDIVLEPMTSYERMIIHTALQDNEKVSTISVGKDPYRKIVIKLVK